MNKGKKKEKFFKNKYITLDLQMYHMSSNFPGFKFYRNNHEEYWIGELTPTEKSKTYKVKLFIYIRSHQGYI